MLNLKSPVKMPLTQRFTYLLSLVLQSPQRKAILLERLASLMNSALLEISKPFQSFFNQPLTSALRVLEELTSVADIGDTHKAIKRL